MRNFQDNFETCKQAFISAFSIFMTIPVICHVTSKKHVVEKSSKLVSGSSLCYVTTFPSLMDINFVVVEI